MGADLKLSNILLAVALSSGAASSYADPFNDNPLFWGSKASQPTARVIRDRKQSQQNQNQPVTDQKNIQPSVPIVINPRIVPEYIAPKGEVVSFLNAFERSVSHKIMSVLKDTPEAKLIAGSDAIIPQVRKDYGQGSITYKETRTCMKILSYNDCDVSREVLYQTRTP